MTEPIKLHDHERQEIVQALDALPIRERSPEGVGEVVDAVIATLNKQRIRDELTSTACAAPWCPSHALS